MAHKNQGFTLYETIFSLFIISIVVLLFPFVLAYIKPVEQNKLQAKEVELFFMQTSREIHNAVNIYLQNHHLVVVLSNGDRASYEHYNNIIRRRVNNRGHEVLLQNIESVRYEIHEKLVTIHIEGKRGEQYERTFTLMGENNDPT